MPELRKDPVMGRWVIIATERARRPSDFPARSDKRKGPPCAFCGGHEEETPPEVLSYRPDGSPPNSPGWQVRVVPNKFPALRIEGEPERRGVGLYDMMNGVGAHEVIVETPNHELAMADLDDEALARVVWAYRERIADLKKDRRFRYVLIFKNHGAEAGASLEHSHSQLIALPIVPLNVVDELHGAREYFEYRERCVFCDIVRQAAEDPSRVVAEDRDFITLVPFASRFPFEMWVLPKRHAAAFEEVDESERASFARNLGGALRRLRRTVNDPPFNYTIHSAPLGQPEGGYYHWHLEILPKLTRVAGFEWGSGFYINPVPPEDAARFLREAAAR